MHQLADLKTFFIKNNVEIVEFPGWYLKTKNGNVWTLAHDVFYKNGVAIENIDKYFNPDKKEKAPNRHHSPIKIK